MQSVRINPKAHKTLKGMAEQTQRSMAELMDDAIDELHRKFVLEATNNAYAALQKDKKAWAVELAERRQWDAASISDIDLDDWK